MKATITLKGGSGSGHHGHQGRPGKQGGSSPGKGGGLSMGTKLTRARNTKTLLEMNGFGSNNTKTHESGRKVVAKIHSDLPGIEIVMYNADGSKHATWWNKSRDRIFSAADDFLSTGRFGSKPVGDTQSDGIRSVDHLTRTSVSSRVKPRRQF